MGEIVLDLAGSIKAALFSDSLQGFAPEYNGMERGCKRREDTGEWENTNSRVGNKVLFLPTATTVSRTGHARQTFSKQLGVIRYVSRNCVNMFIRFACEPPNVSRDFHCLQRDKHVTQELVFRNFQDAIIGVAVIGWP